MAYINVNNVKLYYEDVGESDNVIFFSHGLFMSSKLFAKQITVLKQFYRCIAYDQRGQGQSENPPEKIIDIETNYADAVALIEALKIKPVHFVGLSMGGFVGMRIAARRPDLLKTLTLMATSDKAEPFFATIKYRCLAFLWQLYPSNFITAQALQGLFGKTFLHDKKRQDELLFWRQHLQLQRLSAKKSLLGVTKRAAITVELKKITLPTLIMSGTEDTIFSPSCMYELQKQLPQAEFISIPLAGHSLSIENPEVVNQALLVFLQKNN